MSKPSQFFIASEDAGVFTPGDYLLGLVRESEDGDPIVLTGGAKLDVDQGDPGDVHYLRVDDFSTTRYGANKGTASVVDIESYFRAAEDLTTAIWYRAVDSWIPTNRGPVEHELLDGLSTEITAQETLDICFPGFDPRAVIPIAVELLLHPAIDGNVGLYSPGTQTHWGEKGDIREEYERYGLSRTSDGSDSVKPLPEVFPTGYVSDGVIKTHDETPSNTCLVLSKNLDDFHDLNGLNAIILNHISRKRADDDADIEKLTANHPNTPVVRLSSPLTKIEQDGAPAYQPPEGLSSTSIRPTPETLSAVTGSRDSIEMTHSTSLSGYFPDDDEELDPPFPPTSTDLLGYTDPADIVVSSVEAQSITDELKLLFDQFHTFRDVEYYGAANKVFNAQMFFERLALPLRIYDEKIEERSLEGEIYLPKTSAEYLEELREHRIDGGGGSLLESTKAVEALRDFLWDSCPMFDEIVATIDESVQEGDSVAVFNGSKKTGELLSEALYDESGVDAELLDEHLRVVNQDTVRDIPPVETLVFCGLQRPGHTSLYCHPRVDETVIFTYSDWMHRTIKDHVDAAMERHREFTGLPDHRIPTPEVHGLSDAEPDDGGPDPSYPDEQDGPEDDQDRPKDEDTVNLPAGLSPEDLHRLEDLVRLSPTKNSELRDQWGLTSGKEVYQYLASNLSEYYRRNEEQLIVPTGRGRDLVEEQS